jgi:hypothetical protein
MNVLIYKLVSFDKTFRAIIINNIANNLHTAKSDNQMMQPAITLLNKGF